MWHLRALVFLGNERFSIGGGSGKNPDAADIRWRTVKNYVPCALLGYVIVGDSHAAHLFFDLLAGVFLWLLSAISLAKRSSPGRSYRLSIAELNAAALCDSFTAAPVTGGLYILNLS